MQKEAVVLTRSGYNELKTEYETLVKEQRPSVVELISEARSHGDLSENEAYQQARRDQALIETRIEELEEILKKAKVVDQTSGGGVQVGSMITLKRAGQTQVYQIVGEHESDISARKISYSSPIGKALLGKQVGYKVEIEAPAGKTTFEIIKINNS